VAAEFLVDAVFDVGEGFDIPAVYGVLLATSQRGRAREVNIPRRCPDS